jgi:predicted phage terminase large subunit-like protein
VADDLEDTEQTASEDQRRKLREWFAGTLLKAGDPNVNVVVVGTVLHYDSLLANLVGAGGITPWPGWDGCIYRAVESFSPRQELWETWNGILSGRVEHAGSSGPAAAKAYFEANRGAMLEGTAVLWPQREDYRSLMELRLREGAPSFDAEKQNEPVNPADCLFKPQTFAYWDDEFADAQALLRHLGTNAGIYGAWDPSMGRRGGRGDLSAVVTLAYDRRDQFIYVLDADLERRSPSETIARIVTLAGLYRYQHFGVESNGFRELIVKQLEDALRREGRSMRVTPIVHSGDKKARIESLEPLVSQGKIRFCRRHIRLMDQLRQFPLAAHDDGPDALELAVHACRARRPYIAVMRGW